MVLGQLFKELVIFLAPLNGGVVADFLRRHVAGCPTL
jgi:hypothetical protein